MRAKSRDGVLLVEAPGDYWYVSTLPPGRGRSRFYAFIHVDEGFRSGPSLSETLSTMARRAGLPAGTPVFLTAAMVDDPVVVEGEGFTVVMTVGLRPVTCPGGAGLVEEPLPGTINILVGVHEPLTESAAHDLLRVVAEAKAAGAWEALLRCPGDPPHRPVGTASDAIMVAWPGPGPGAPAVAGHNTRIGSRVGLAVYRALYERAARSPYWFFERAAGLPLSELPVGPRLLGGLLRDPVVASLLVAARELDVRAASGTLPASPSAEAYNALAQAAASRLGAPVDAGATGFVDAVLRVILRALGVER